MSYDSINVLPVVLNVLIKRGIKEVGQISEFLNPKISTLSDPFFIVQMKKACEIIEDAIYLKKKIFLYADGDVDGVAGAAILSLVFRSLRVPFEIKLTHRLEDYEIEPDFVHRVQKLGYDLLIMIDTGTTSNRLIEYCEKTKFPLIIIDHHRALINCELKNVIIINPSLKRGDNHFESLTGSGLVFKLVQSLRGILSFFPEEIFISCIELATIGTLGDYGLLNGENRVIVKLGLKFFENTSIPGIEEFKKYFYVPKKTDEITPITHYLNPRLNTPGRFGKPELALKVLTASKDENIHGTLEEIDSLENKKRIILREMSGAITKIKITSPPFIIFDNIPVSFSGTFAARMSEKFQLPSLVAIKQRDIIQGSARSFDRLDIYEFFDKYRDLFISFGGHRNAVGFKMKEKFLGELKEVWKKLSLGNKPVNQIQDIYEINFEMLTIPVLEQLQLLRPFGPGNPPVVFKSFPVQCIKITRREKSKIIAWVKQRNKIFEARFPSNFKMPDNFLSIYYRPVLQKSGNLYTVWLDVVDYSITL